MTGSISAARSAADTPKSNDSGHAQGSDSGHGSGGSTSEWPTSQVQPVDYLPGMMMSNMGGYGGVSPYMGMGGIMGGYPAGMGMFPGMGMMPPSTAGQLGQYNTGMGTGNFVTPGSSPLEQVRTQNTVLSGQHAGLEKWDDTGYGIGAAAGAGGGALGGGVLGGLVGKLLGKTLLGAAVGAAVGGATGYGILSHEGARMGREFGVNWGAKDAVYNDVVRSGDYKAGNAEPVSH